MANIVLCGGISVVPYWRPIGIYQIANILRKKGYTVQVIDSFPWLVYTDFDKLLKIFDKFVDKDTLWIGFGSTWFYRIENMFDDPQPKAGSSDGLMTTKPKQKLDAIKENTRLLNLDEIDKLKTLVYSKNPEIKFVMGGARAFSGRKGFASPLIDCYIEGFADATVVEYTEYLDGKRDSIEHIKNEDGSINIIHDHKGESFDFVHDKHSWHPSDLVIDGEILPLETARGCIFSCAFCAYPLNGRKKLDYLKSSDILKDQFLENYEKYNVTDYFFTEDTFNDSPKKIRILHDEVVDKLPFKITFSSYMRLDLLNAHRDTIPLLYNMGVRSVMFGIESMNYEANKTVGKGIRKEKILEMGEVLQKEWPETIKYASWMLGLPNDGEQEISEWLEEICKPDFPFDISAVYPLTLDRWLHKKNIWNSKFNLHPEKYGYTFPQDKNSFFWVNNKGYSLADAVRMRNSYNKTHIKSKEKHLFEHNAFVRSFKADTWKQRLQKRMDFNVKYMDRLLDYNG